MTKKLICLLLAAFLGVSIIALFAACHSSGQAPPADEAASTAVPSESSMPDAAGQTAADVLLSEIVSEETET